VTRTNAVRALALAATLALWLPGLGFADLVATWFLDEPTIVHDLGYGAITGILAPAGLLAQARRPGTGIAGLQQIALCVVAYALAGAIADSGYFVLAAALGTALVALLVLHPVGGLFLAVPDEVSPLLAGLALLPAAPLVVYALDAAGQQRDGAPPTDFHAGLGSWAGLTAMGFGIVLVALLAAFRTTGWRVPAWSAAGAAAVWGAGCMWRPDAPGSGGRIWGALAVAWAVSFVLAARFVERATAPTE
jgi:hypothetical protein